MLHLKKLPLHLSSLSLPLVPCRRTRLLTLVISRNRTRGSLARQLLRDRSLLWISPTLRKRIAKPRERGPPCAGRASTKHGPESLWMIPAHRRTRMVARKLGGEASHARKNLLPKSGRMRKTCTRVRMLQGKGMFILCRILVRRRS